MNCSDVICQKLMTCKWDSPVSKVYCEAMWYPEPEKETFLSHAPEMPVEQEVYTYVHREEPIIKTQPKQEEGGYKWSQQ
tara:strand:+ start:28579 stop:28815 length:237 start_codon:yes stop_codon:yes gene_type:complete